MTDRDRRAESPRRGDPYGRAVGRRATLAAVGAGLVGGVGGCLAGPSFPAADVLAGPDGRLVFEPAVLTVSVRDTVRWGFPTAGHNVCCRPDDSDAVVLPDASTPFASYDPGASPHRALVPRGGSYEHTFDTAGRHRYVCVPHVDRGMTASVVVE